MARERRSLQDLIRSRQQSGFVGRHGQLAEFQENLALPADDERRRFLFNIHGNAGVGKTYLTKQLRQVAAGHGCLTAYVDETADDVVSAMTVIAGEFSRGGARLGDFEKRAAAYRKRRHELESDPQAPDGVATFLTKTAITIGLAAARDVPLAGSLLAPVDAAAALDQFDRARAYLARKFSDHADVRLLLSPADELTPVFVAGVNRAAKTSRSRCSSTPTSAPARYWTAGSAACTQGDTGTCQAPSSPPSRGRARSIPTVGGTTSLSLPTFPWSRSVTLRRASSSPARTSTMRTWSRSS